MDLNRNRASHLTLAAPAPGAPAPHTGIEFPLPRRHRRLLAATGAAAVLLLGGLSTGTAVQSLHSGTAAPADSALR